jgi:hypothetical protein
MTGAAEDKREAIMAIEAAVLPLIEQTSRSDENPSALSRAVAEPIKPLHHCIIPVTAG